MQFKVMKVRFNHKKELEYVGREPSAATATGHASTHLTELESFLIEAFK